MGQQYSEQLRVVERINRYCSTIEISPMIGRASACGAVVGAIVSEG